MKIKKLGSAIILTGLGAILVSPSVTYAEVISNQESTGKLQVNQGTLDPEGGVVDPEKPEGEPLPTNPEGPIKPNDNVGSKGIMGVSDLNFGDINVGVTTANASSIIVDGKERGNIVSFGDVSGSYTGYTITGALTSEFSNGTTTLSGSTISFTNPILQTSGEGKITASPATQTLSKDGGAAVFVTAKETEGAGKWSMEFGQSEEYNKENNIGDGTSTANTSVNLSIPTTVANSMTAGAYIATVTWTMESTVPEA